MPVSLNTKLVEGPFEFETKRTVTARKNHDWMLVHHGLDFCRVIAWERLRVLNLDNPVQRNGWRLRRHLGCLLL